MRSARVLSLCGHLPGTVAPRVACLNAASPVRYSLDADACRRKPASLGKSAGANGDDNALPALPREPVAEGENVLAATGDAKAAAA